MEKMQTPPLSLDSQVDMGGVGRSTEATLHSELSCYYNVCACQDSGS